MNVEILKNNLREVINRYHNKPEFTGEVCRDVMAADCLSAISDLSEENSKLRSQLPDWHKIAEGDFPKADGFYKVAVRNKNMDDDGIWLVDLVEFDGEKWGKRCLGTWEDIVLWTDFEYDKSLRNI